MLRLLSIILFLNPLISAADQSKHDLGITIYGSFLHSSQVENVLFFFDKIEKNDSFEMRKALRNHKIDTLILSSPGGSVFEGLQIAGIIFDRKLTTYIPKNATCASACAFMFFAGQHRISEGRLGVHQFFSNAGQQKQEIATTQEVAQFTVSEIIGFLNEFGTPPFVYEKMFQRTQMYYFSEQEMKMLVTDQPYDFNSISSKVFNFINLFKREIPLDEHNQSTSVMPSKQLSRNDLAKKVQEELNRVGCSLGAVDGKIGPASKRALKLYSKNTGIEYNAENFYSHAFYQTITQSPKQTCPKIIAKGTKPKPEHSVESKKAEPYKCTAQHPVTAILGVFILWSDCIVRW